MDRTPDTLKEHKADEHRISAFAEFIKQIVFGGNDGIVTTFAIVAGFAGAGAEGAAQVGGVAVLLFGLANLFADAAAMGLGEFLSARSEHDLYNEIRKKEAYEIKHNPEMERLEAIEILIARGYSQKDATTVVEIMEKYPDHYADFMMTYEIEMANPEGESPALNGLVTFFAFIIFGAIPLIPYFLMDPTQTTFTLSVIATFSALIALGILRYLVVRNSIIRSVGETVFVGGVCAAVAYSVGLFFA